MHILEDTFYQWVFADVAASAQEQAHLLACPACQEQLATLQRMAAELQIARASEPTAAALSRYFQLFDQVEQLPSLVQRLGDFITAQLQWDGRLQPAWQGVRNAQVASYRLLYATEQAEIELLVAPQDGQFQVEGEVIPLDEWNGEQSDSTNASHLLPAQCVVHNDHSGTPIITAACEANGRFHLGTLSAGHYQLHFVPNNVPNHVPGSTGNTLVITDLELR